MSVKAKCPQCARELTIPPELFGKAATCTGCGARIRVPAMSGTGGSPEAATPPLKTAERLEEPPHGQADSQIDSGHAVVTPSGGPPPLPAAASAPEETADMPQVGPLGPPEIHTEPGAGSITSRVRRKSPLSPQIAVGGLAVVGFAAVMGVALSLMGGSHPDAFRFLPADSQFVVSVNLAQAYESPLYQRLAESNPGLVGLRERLVDESGIAPDDVERIVFGGSGPLNMVAVAELSKPIDTAAFIEKETRGGAREEKIGEAVFHVSGRQAYHFPNDRTMVVGPAATLREVLDPQRTAGFSQKMQGLVGELGFSRTAAMAFAVGSGGSGLAGELPVQAEMVRNMDGATLHLDIDADIRAELEVHCADSKIAEDMQKMVDGLLAMARQNSDLSAEARELVDAIEISVSGSRLRARATLTGEQIDRFSQQMPGGMPFH